MRGGDVSKRNLMELHDRFLQDSTYRDSQLKIGWTEVKCIEMDKFSTGKLLQLSIAWRVRKIFGKIGISHWTHQAEMHRWNSDQTSEQQSQLWTVSTVNLERSDLNQSPLYQYLEGGIRLLLPVSHGGSGIDHLVELINSSMSITSEVVEWAASKRHGDLFNILRVEFWHFSFVVVRSLTADSNLLQPDGCVNRTPSHVTFSRVSQHSFSMSHVTLAQGVLRARHPCFMVLLSWYSSTLWVWLREASKGLTQLCHLLHQKVQGNQARKSKSSGEDLLFALNGERFNISSLVTTKTLSDLSLGSRSFLHRVNDQVRKRQKNNPQWMQQKRVKSILWYGKCSWLSHCKHLCSLGKNLPVPPTIFFRN